jgi:hypothetical protein
MNASHGELILACPYFMPTQKCDDGTWIHPARLPLGAGWRGTCTADPEQHVPPTELELHEYCNMGYALACSRLPSQRSCDALRFGVTNDLENGIRISYVCESDHRPAGNGILEYDTATARWTQSHADPRIQKMAQCFLESYLNKTRAATAVSDAS